MSVKVRGRGVASEDGVEMESTGGLDWLWIVVRFGIADRICCGRWIGRSEGVFRRMLMARVRARMRRLMVAVRYFVCAVFADEDKETLEPSCPYVFEQSGEEA